MEIAVYPHKSACGQRDIQVISIVISNQESVINYNVYRIITK